MERIGNELKKVYYVKNKICSEQRKRKEHREPICRDPQLYNKSKKLSQAEKIKVCYRISKNSAATHEKAPNRHKRWIGNEEKIQIVNSNKCKQTLDERLKQETHVCKEGQETIKHVFKGSEVTEEDGFDCIQEITGPGAREIINKLFKT